MASTLFANHTVQRCIVPNVLISVPALLGGVIRYIPINLMYIKLSRTNNVHKSIGIDLFYGNEVDYLIIRPCCFI